MKNTKIGILGGGQLGMLLVQAGIAFPARFSIYDPNPECSAHAYTDNYVQGDFDDYDKILKFGMEHDIILFETEKVNVDALFELEKKGKKVICSPETLAWIQDKGEQKDKLKEIGVPVVEYQDVPAAEVKNYSGAFPIVQKWRRGGYDGYGVNILKEASDLENAKEVDSIFETMVDLDKEISMIVCRDQNGNVAVYPPVEMVFDPKANLLDYQLAPARIDDSMTAEIEKVCKDMAEKLNFVGIYAVELFVDKSGQFFVNEIAPRPHNSGHHTISANITSQYEQQIRIALGFPLGATDLIMPCVLVNLLADESSGPVNYVGLHKAYEIPNVQYTLYGKQEVRPRRKMGHALVMEKDLEKALKTVDDIRSTLTITSHE